MRRARPLDGDAVLVERAARRLGLQAAALVAAAIVAVAAALGLLVVHDQRGDDESLIHRAAASADDTGDPPAAMWLVIVRGGVLEQTRGLPAGLPDAVDLTAVSGGARPIERRLDVGSEHVELLTQARPDGAVQAVLDLDAQDTLERRIVEALVAVAVVALALSAGIGSYLARRAVRPLATALHSQRAFVADASHELRTPLALLSTRAQLLRDGIAEDPGRGDVLPDADGVVRDVRRLTAIVDDLLMAADPRGRADGVPVHLDLICREVLESAAPYAEGHGVQLHLAGDARCVALGTVTAVHRAVLALVDNAVRHTPAGGRVTVELGSSGGRAQVTVSDTGPGLDAADAERLLGRFASGSGPVVSAGGRRRYGLGLALVRDVAARYGGDLQILPPSAGGGASIRLELPVPAPDRRRARSVLRTSRVPPPGRSQPGR